DIESDAAAFGFTLATLDALDDVLTPPGDALVDQAIVVASQGHYDEEALAAALKSGVPYVALVASRARGATVKALLEEQGVPNVASIRNPAGIDLGARTAPEVALSILAEIVQARASQPPAEPKSATAAVSADAAAGSSIAIDPVCHMEVDIATARYKADLDGVTYYFCAASCKAPFLKGPDDYLSPTQAS